MALTDRSGEYRTMLLAKRSSLLAGLALQADSPDQCGTAEEDQAKAIQDQAVALRLNHLDYLQFLLVEEALDRTRTGDFGICCGCEKPIAPKRLAALPWAKYCLACQQERDAWGEETPQSQLPAGRAPASADLVTALMRQWRDEREL